MKKQWILLLVLAVALTAAPAAMADHCERCRPINQLCFVSPNYGFALCDDSNGCYVEFPCGDHVAVAAALPLAAEFTVASVERLDEPQTAETRVASLDTPAPLTHR